MNGESGGMKVQYCWSWTGLDIVDDFFVSFCCGILQAIIELI